METLSDELLDILENNNFSCDGEITEQDGKYYVEINQSTPEGEDWWEIIWFDGTKDSFTKAVSDRTNDFDVYEESEVYIENRGTKGIPNSIKDLIEDAEWKKEILKALSKALQDKETSPQERELALTQCCIYISMNEDETQEEAEKRICDELSNLGIMLGDYDAEIREL